MRFRKEHHPDLGLYHAPRQKKPLSLVLVTTVYYGACVSNVRRAITKGVEKREEEEEGLCCCVTRIGGGGLSHYGLNNLGAFFLDTASAHSPAGRRKLCSANKHDFIHVEEGYRLAA